MAMKRALVLAIAGTLGVATPTAAQFMMIGAGTVSCGRWTALRRSGSALGAEQWILGFLSGIGYIGDIGVDPLRGTDADGVWGWIDNYCISNPTENLEKAGVAFRFDHPH